VFQRVLVPVDFTPRSLRAARAAARIAATTRAMTTLLHVIERIDEAGPAGLETFYRKLEGAARRKLEKFAVPFAARGFPVKAEIVYGKPVAEILRYAKASRSDLIVMSSHKLTLRRAAENWGTTSYKVGILSRCPVLLIK
jgi:nucleotide-binding universal stress UspA family protein